MTELYTSAFTSLDFVEGDSVERAEVFVVVGKGNITEIKASGSGKAKQVIIDAGRVHNGRPLYSKGWAPADSDIITKAQEALDNDEVVEFRIETVRNKGVDRSEPIDNLRKGMENARENVTLSVARIKLNSEDTWTEGIMRTNPKEDKIKTGRTAADLTDEELGAKSGSSNSGSNNSGWANSVEPQPWIAKLSNGSVNPGSYHVAALSNIYGFVADYNRENELELSVDDIRKVAKTLLTLAGKLQLAVFNGELETVELDKQSHTRARALLFENIKNQHVLTAETVSDNTALKGWMKNIYSSALEQWKWSIEGVEAILAD